MKDKSRPPEISTQIFASGYAARRLLIEFAQDRQYGRRDIFAALRGIHPIAVAPPNQLFARDGSAKADQLTRKNPSDVLQRRFRALELITGHEKNVPGKVMLVPAGTGRIEEKTQTVSNRTIGLPIVHLILRGKALERVIVAIGHDDGDEVALRFGHRRGAFAIDQRGQTIQRMTPDLVFDAKDGSLDQNFSNAAIDRAAIPIGAPSGFGSRDCVPRGCVHCSFRPLSATLFNGKQSCRDLHIHERSNFVFVAFFDEAFRDRSHDHLVPMAGTSRPPPVECNGGASRRKRDTRHAAIASPDRVSRSGNCHMVRPEPSWPSGFSEDRNAAVAGVGPRLGYVQ